MRTNQSTLMGIPISCDSQTAVLEGIAKRIEERAMGGTVSITNTESMYHALRDPEHMAFIQRSSYSLCDGVGVIAAGLFWGLRIPRYNGPILQLDCSRIGQEKGWRHFYYGGKEGVADLMTSRLKSQFPRLNVVGTYCPPFKPLTSEEDDAIVKLINDAKPDIVWVGLGLLKQERWALNHVNRISAPWIIPVGAAFDYHSGAIPWAPKWIRAIGMEWLFRLAIQPRIRAKRYWWSLVFVLQAIGAGVARSVRAGLRGKKGGDS